METKKLIGFLTGVMISLASFGQTCTSSPTTLASNINFTAVSWTGTGGVTAAQCTAIANGTNTITAANFIVDLSNGVILTISNNVTIHGNFDLTGGPGSELSVNGGGASTTLHVTGDLGDAVNNGVIYNVQASTDHIQVDGTLFGKNNDAFTGFGTISGGTLSVKNGTTCGVPCPATGGFTSCTSGDLFCTTSGVLPVVLTVFDSKSNETSIQINWSTASEINFDYFDLQKSNEGWSFNSIARIKGHGTTNKKHSYQFEDTFPFIGKNYYRLTSVDFDNYQETFGVLVHEFSGRKEFHISPNPSDGQSVTLNFNFDNEPGEQLVIFDSIGSIVGTYQVSGSGHISFANPLKGGVYFARYSSTSFTKTVRFLVK